MLELLKDFFSDSLGKTVGIGILAICGLFLLVAIFEPKPISEELLEKGEVLEVQYQADSRQTVMGSGISSNGGVVFTSHQVGEREKFLIVFKCAHGKVFAVNNSEVYAKVKKGDKVSIKYVELGYISNGKKEVVDYDFIDANPIKE